MFKKISVKISGKSYFFAELSVGEYWAMLVDYELFLMEYFKKHNLNYKNISEENISKIFENLFEIQTKDSNPFASKKEELQKFADEFHISVGRFMYAMHLSYQDVCEMPFSIFVKMIDDFSVISGEKEKKEVTKMGTKQQLQNLFSMQ